MIVGLDARYGLMSQRRGIGVYIYHLLEEWRCNPPQDVTFVAFADGRADPDLVTRFSTPSMEVSVLHARPFAIWEQWALPRAALQRRVDLLHAMANVAPLRVGVPFVVTFFDVIEWHRGHDFPGNLAPRHRLSRLYRMNAMAKNSKTAKHVLTISHHAAKDIERTLHVPAEKMTVIPLGYSTRSVAPDIAILEEIGLRPREYAMAFGALDDRKNIAMLLDLWTHQSMPCSLVVVGFEPEALTAVERVYGNGRNLYLLGFQSDARVRALLEQAAMFLYPSFYEGFGLPVLEAMAAATPVIVAAGTAAEEVSGGGALAAPANRPDAWKTAVEILWADEALWSRLSQDGPRIAARHDWHATACAVLEVYRETCRKPRPA